PGPPRTGSSCRGRSQHPGWASSGVFWFRIFPWIGSKNRLLAISCWLLAFKHLIVASLNHSLPSAVASISGSILCRSRLTAHSRQPIADLSRFIHHRERDITFFHHLARDFEFLYLLLARQVVHQVEHQFFEDHAQSASAHLAGHGLLGDGAGGFIAEFQPHVLKFEQPLVLLDDRVLWPRQDLNQRVFVEILEQSNDWQPAHEFRN